MSNICVALCTPHYDRPHSKFVMSINHMWKPTSLPGGHIVGLGTHKLETEGILVEEARNIITAQALAATPRVTHLLWIDDDMEFPTHALKRLLEHDVPIVGGLCHSRRPPYQPILGRKYAEGIERAGYGWCYYYPPDSLFEVDVTGGAFLLVKREVYEAMNAKGWTDNWWTKRDGRSEDFSFCERARELGYKILVDTGLEIGHAAEIFLYSGNAKALRPFLWDAWMPDPGTKKGDPVASIIIPTYNQKMKWLKAAVFSASHQTVPVEVIIVDDGSDPPVPFDGWPENVRVVHHLDEGKPVGELISPEGKKLPILTRKPQNRGISAALNTGIKEMKTPWFCWLSSDDILDPRKVQMQLATLQQSGGKLAFHRFQVIGEEGGFSRFSEPPGWRNMEEQKGGLAQACCINGSTVMIHKDVFEQLGGFDPEYKYGQDWEAWARFGQKYFWYCVDEYLGTRRELKSNLTQSIGNSAENDERRLRRDAEDSSIKAKYAWRR